MAVPSRRYEVWDFVRKLLCTAVIALVSPGSIVQVILGLFLSLGALVVCLHYHPYVRLSDTLLANACLAQLFISLFGGFLLKVCPSTVPGCRRG